VGASLPPGSTLTITIAGTIAPDATGDLVNTATVGAGSGATDTDPTNNSATDTDTPGTPRVDLAVTKDDVIWYGDFTRGFLGRLDPKTGRIEEYALPSGPGSLPYAVTSDDRGRIWLAETGPQPNRLVAFDPAQRKFTENIVIAANQANTIRHMTFDKATRQIWFGGDANMIGRVAVAPQPLVP